MLSNFYSVSYRSFLFCGSIFQAINLTKSAITDGKFPVRFDFYFSDIRYVRCSGKIKLSIREIKTLHAFGIT
jgi:hypothetical protein